MNTAPITSPDHEISVPQNRPYIIPDAPDKIIKGKTIVNVIITNKIMVIITDQGPKLRKYSAKAIISPCLMILYECWKKSGCHKYIAPNKKIINNHPKNLTIVPLHTTEQ